MNSNYDLSNPFLAEPASPPGGSGASDPRVLRAIESNTDLLQQLIGRLQTGELSPHAAAANAATESPSQPQQERIDTLTRHIELLEDQIHYLSDSNRELAAKVLYENDFRKSGTEGWDERKRQIQETLQDDRFDIDQFLGVVELQDPGDRPRTVEDVLRHFGDLIQENTRLERKVTGLEFAGQQQDKEVAQFKQTIEKLEKKLSEAFANQRAVAAIEMPQASSPNEQRALDEDPVIQKERERLSFLQQECEEKMREMYIQSSLERAKASREQTELHHQKEQLEEQIRVLEMELRRHGIDRK